MTAEQIIEKIFIPLFAAFGGAALAFRYQRISELKREKRAILQTLMMNRNVTVDELDFIKYVNAIPLIFMGDKKVIALYHKWIAYTRPPLFEKGLYVDVFYQLLYEMGQCSGYKSLTISDIQENYAPKALDLHYPRPIPPNEPKGDSGGVSA